MLLLLRSGVAGTPPPPPTEAGVFTGTALYPGSSTFPDTTTYPGQGIEQLLQMLYSTDDVSIATPTWNYVAEGDMRSFSVSRGRESDLDEDGAGTATVVLDNRARVFDPTRLNICTNPSFEGTTAGWDTSASWFLNAGGATSLTQLSPFVGSSAMIVTTDAVSTQEGVRFISVPVVSGKTYTFSAYVWLNSGNASMRIGLGATAIGSNDVAFTAVAGSWNRFSVTTTATGTGTMQAAIYGATAAVRNFQIDGVLIEEGSTVLAYLEQSVRPLSRWWLRAQFNGETQDLIKGYAESYDQEWPGGGWSDATVTVSIVDEFKVLSLAALPVTNPPRDNYGDVIAFDNPSGYWTMGEQDFQAETVNGEPGPRFTSIVAGDGLPIGGGGWQSSGAVIGDERQNRGALLFTQGTSNTTGELRPEDDLAMTALSEFTVEVWLNAASYGASTETVVRGPWGINYKFEIAVTTTGGIVGTVRNQAGTVFTVSGGQLAWDNPLTHVVLRLGAGILTLVINGAVVSTASFSGRTSEVTDITTFWTGLLTVDPNTHGDWRIGGDGINTGYYVIDELAFYRYALSYERISAHYVAGQQRGFRAQRSGERINAVLDASTSQAPRSISNDGRFVSPRYMHGQAPLEEIRVANTAEAVDARLFSGRDGTMTFLNADHRAAGSAYSTYTMTLGDGAGELSYLETDFDYSDSFLANEWNVTRENGQLQTASDPTSISKYFKRTQSLSGLQLVNDSDAAAVATAMLAKYKDPHLRCIRVSLSALDRATLTNALRRELGDRIRLLRTPPGGGARIDQQLFIQKIEISGDDSQNPWAINWTVSPL